MRRLVAGARRVFHLAGCARPWVRDPDEYVRVNVTGTEHVCSACADAGVEVLLHTSTNLVEASEPGTPKPLLTRYQHTKRHAETAVAAWRARGVPSVVVRPTRVFGPGPLTPANSSTLMIAQYRRGRFRVRLADGGARGNWVHVGDVVEGMLLAADPRHAGHTYTLGGDNASVPDLLAALDTILGRTRWVVPLPLPAARLVARLATFSATFGATPIITRDWVDLLSHDWPSSSAAARQDLGYRPRSLPDGLRHTVAWLASGGDPW